MAQQVSSIPSHHIGVLFFGNQKNPPFSLDFLSFAEFFFSWGLGGGGFRISFPPGFWLRGFPSKVVSQRRAKRRKVKRGEGGKGKKRLKKLVFFFFFQ